MLGHIYKYVTVVARIQEMREDYVIERERDSDVSLSTHDSQAYHHHHRRHCSLRWSSCNNASKQVNHKIS